MALLPNPPHMLPLAYKNIQAFSLSKELVLAAYAATAHLKEGSCMYLKARMRQTALEAHFAIVSAAFCKKRKKQRRYYRTAQQCLVLMDAALHLMQELGEPAPNAEQTSFAGLLAAAYTQLEALVKH